MQDAEIQTDPVMFGDIELAQLNFDAEDASYANTKVHEIVTEEQGTDAPRFIILNVLPGSSTEELITMRN